MSIKSKLGILLVAAAATVLVGSGLVSANSGSSDRHERAAILVANTETHDGSLYAAGELLNVEGTVNGDVYCGVMTATISGTVEGDVICGAQAIRITGTVKGDVRLAGMTVAIDGTVEGNASVFSQTFDINSGARVGGDLNGAAASAVVSGDVGRDVLFAASSMTINGEIGRNVGGEYERFVVSEGAKINGALNYASHDDATIAEGVVTGEVTRNEPTRAGGAQDAGDFAVGAIVYTLVSLLLIALAVVLIAPRLVHTVSQNGVNRLLPSLLVGFFVVFGGPFLLVFLAMTIIGIPLAGFVFLVWLLILLLAGPAFAYYLGRAIMQDRTANQLIIMLVGATVLILVYFVPVVNAFALFAAATIGSGMLVLSLTDRYTRPSYRLDKTETKKKSTKKD